MRLVRSGVGGALVIAAALAASAGCSLVIDPDDHVGGSMDAGARDASLDAARGDAAASDAGTDAGPPPPPECDDSSDCGAPGVVECIESRCRFCATPDADPRTLRSEATLRPQIALAFGTRSAGPPFVHVATFGDAPGTATEWHRFELGMPEETWSIDALNTPCPDRTTPYARVLGGGFRESSAGQMTFGFLGPRDDRTYWQFMRWGEEGMPSVSVYDCRPNTATTMLGPLVPIEIQGTFGELFVARYVAPGGVAGMVSVESGYGNEEERTTLTGLTTDPVAHVAHANEFAAASTTDRARVMFWRSDATSTVPGGIETPGRTTDADLAATSATDMLMAYGAGSVIRLVPVHCEGGSCDPVGESSDVRTEAAELRAVRIAMSGSMPMLLAVERSSAGSEQLTLRALRPSRAPWDAPGGGRALVIETAPPGETIADAQLVTTGTGASVRHAVAWLRSASPASATVRAQGLAGACEL